MKTIIIDGVEYGLTPIKKTEPIIVEQHLKFEVYPNDLGEHNWEDAKKVCEDLGDGWRLPTREELHFMWLNKDFIGGFTAAFYWSSSSSKFDKYLAWNQHFATGGQNLVLSDSQNYKSRFNTYYVRAVRDIKE